MINCNFADGIAINQLTFTEAVLIFTADWMFQIELEVIIRKYVRILPERRL